MTTSRNDSPAARITSHARIDHEEYVRFPIVSVISLIRLPSLGAL
jgi:hypothetical protein